MIWVRKLAIWFYSDLDLIHLEIFLVKRNQIEYIWQSSQGKNLSAVSYTQNFVGW